MAYLSQLNVNNDDYDLKDTEARRDLQSTQTVSGNPITLTDAAPIYAESLVVELEPKQDLHGYDNPWVGGAGKNLLEVTRVSTSSIIVHDDGTVTINGTFESTNWAYLTDSITLKPGTYILSGTPSNVPTGCFIYDDSTFGGWFDYDGSGASKTIETETTGKICIRIPAGTHNFTFKPMVCLSTVPNPTTFAPYSNICPITGYTECEVESVGVNQWDEEWELGIYDTTTGAKIDSANRIRSKNYIKVLPNTTYNFVSTSAGTLILLWYDKNKNLISVDNSSALRTSPNNAFYLTFYTYNNTVTYNHDISINYPSTITEYEPYRSSNATIQFGQTVYGGRSDFTDGGTSDEWGYVEFDGSNDEQWEMYGSGSASAYAMTIVISDIDTAQLTDTSKIKTNYLRTVTNTDTWGNYDAFISKQVISNSIVCGIRTITSVADWRTFLSSNPLQVCYKKATPSTIATPPTEFKLLQDTNHITTNGTTIQLGYQPDNVIGELKGMIQDLWDYVLAH